MNRAVLGAWAAGAVLAAALSYPTIVRPGSVARIDTGDGRFSVWNVAWVARTLLEDPRHLFDANIFHPHRGTLAYSEANLVAGALGVPVYALTRNPVATHNVVVFAALVFAFVAMWALVRRLAGRPAAAYVAATAFAFAPFVAARTAHIQLLMVWVFPVAFLAFHRLEERPTPGRGLALGAALALAGLACGYYGIFAGLGVGVAAVWFGPARRAPGRYVAALAIAVATAAVLVAPVLGPYLELRSGTGARQTVNLEEARAYSADARAYLTSPAHLHRAIYTRVDRWITGSVTPGREVLFPGFVVLGLAGAAIGAGGRRRGSGAAGPAGASRVTGFYAALAGLAAWASFGPAAGLYSALAHTVPFMSFLRAPARFGIVVVFALAVLAGIGLARLLEGRAGRRWLAPVLVVAAAAEVSAAPWPLAAVPPLPEAYRHLATLPRGPVVEFHFPYRQTDLHRHTRYMFTSMWHWQPLINGYSDYIPPDFREIAVPINAFPDPGSFRILRDRGARYVVVHLDTYGPGDGERVLARFPPYREYLRPIVDRGPVRLYEIVGWPEGRP